MTGPMQSDDSPPGSAANPYADSPDVRPSTGDPYAGMALNHANMTASHKKGKGGMGSGAKPKAKKMGGGKKR